MRLSPTGRYDQITIRISEDIPEDSCETILTNIKVRDVYRETLLVTEHFTCLNYQFFQTCIN